jgi:hypothetical protein
MLIPAGKFVMGTPEPVPVDEDGFRKKIVVGQAAFAAGVGVLLVLIGTVIIRAMRRHPRCVANWVSMLCSASKLGRV